MSPEKPKLEPIAQSVDERMKHLEKSPWVSDLEFQQIKVLAGYMETIKARAGAIVFQEGSTDTSLWLVVEGQVEVSKHDSASRTKLISRVGAGKTFGELALLDGQPRSASVHACESTILLKMSPRALQRMQDDVPKLANKIILKIARMLSNYVRQTTGRLIEYMEDQ